MDRSSKYARQPARRGLSRNATAIADGLLVVAALAGIAWAAAVFVPLDAVLTPSRTIAGPTVSARFVACAGQARSFCVVDGDTLRVDGQKVRIADIDTPEVFSPQCPSERALGDRATRRLTELLNAGPFELGGYERDEDVYGRKLRILRRDGQSLGAILVAEGLARRWDGARHGWCG